MNENTARDNFILEKIKAGFNPYEVQLLLEKNGFRRISRARIYQIIEINGMKPKQKVGAEKK